MFSWSLAASASTFRNNGFTGAMYANHSKIDTSTYSVLNEEKMESENNMNLTGKSRSRSSYL